MRVGRAANPSARMLNRMAMSPDCVMYQRMRPIHDKTPHVPSKKVSFHPAFLFTNEARNTVKGRKPATNVRSDCKPTPCLISATKAMSGARDHNKYETLFGFTFPFSVSMR